MKKFVCILLVLLLSCAIAAAETVYVTISDGQRKIVLARQAVEATDVDNDGAITICDALFAAHEAAFEGGAEAGFATGDQGYGLSLTKLWGEENGGSYGYYVNDASAYSLADPVRDGDSVRAFAYTDLEAWSDLYCYFTDGETLECAVNAPVSVSLAGQSFDSDWNVVVSPIEGAAITVNGEDAQVRTDASGAAELSFDAPGEYVVSARSESATLVPPVCVVTVAEAK